ncbi:SMP-30/gluconolactonase/LRE family protein [Actinomyces radicidentis]|uniref:SMP-30/gluconolactonase/LRE family protein n=1 Tax=Actinomyces radicidentis TaxID=111015 RepID=UPI0026DFB0E0|nr:SMP-30/gluconolactonase/LRE family protein [Actinomyces radicidentis]
MKAERVSDSITYHGEGPCWWEATGRLRLVDMLAGAVVEFDDDVTPTRMDVPSSVASVIRPRVGGGALVTTEHGVVLGRAEDLSDLLEVTTLLTDSAIRTNEGGCDPDGRLWIGTMAYAQTPGDAVVYRWDGPDAQPVTAWDGATICNGLGFNPDGTCAYWTDTPTGTITLLDYDAGAGLVSPRPFVTIDPEDGYPDGLAVDAEGGVWTALNGGSAVRRYAPDGTLDAVVELPVRQVTSCAFGESGYGTLFITTSRENLPDDVEPAAGSVYAVDAGVRGMAPLPFRG